MNLFKYDKPYILRPCRIIFTGSVCKKDNKCVETLSYWLKLIVLKDKNIYSETKTAEKAMQAKASKLIRKDNKYSEALSYWLKFSKRQKYI